MSETHKVYRVGRGGEDFTILFMKEESFHTESAAYIVTENEYSWRFETEDADYWYNRACKGGMIFW
jgi:hypothetical protein